MVTRKAQVVSATPYRRDLEGMQFGILARMSNESKRRKRKKDRQLNASSVPSFMTGMDVDTRERQVTRVKRHIEDRGGSVVFVYDEPHTSAWKRKKITESDGTVRFEVIRPVYREALKDLQRGLAPSGERMDGLFAVELDRITRDNRDLEDAIDAVKASRRPILELTGTLDLMTDAGRTQARVMVSFKNGQSADTARRVGDMHDAMQELGIPTGGRRPFGWEDDKRTLRRAESDPLYRAIIEITGGRPKGAVVGQWNRAGLFTSMGNDWTVTNFTMMLRNPRLCGYRMVTIPKDEGGTGYPSIKYGSDGEPVAGQWERVCSPEEYFALQEVIGEAPKPGGAHNTRKYLSTGTLRCGKNGCDTPFRARKKRGSKEGDPQGHLYHCPSKSQGGCGGCSIDGYVADLAIVELVLAKWEEEARKRDLKQAPAAWGGQGRLERVHEDMAALRAARDAEPPLISAERYYMDLARYESEERALIRERNKVMKRAAAAAKIPVNLREDWESGKLTLEEKRYYITEVLSAVVVNPVGGGRRKVPAWDRMTAVARREGGD